MLFRSLPEEDPEPESEEPPPQPARVVAISMAASPSAKNCLVFLIFFTSWFLITDASELMPEYLLLVFTALDH